MIRTIVAALLVVGVVGNLHHTLPQILLGYAFVIAAILWLTWPLLSALGRGVRRLRRRRRPTAPAPAVAPRLTQINHHHYYGYNQASPRPQMPHRIDRTLPALPQQAQSRRESTSIYDILDLDEGPR